MDNENNAFIQLFKGLQETGIADYMGIADPTNLEIAGIVSMIGLVIFCFSLVMIGAFLFASPLMMTGSKKIKWKRLCIIIGSIFGIGIILMIAGTIMHSL